MRMLLLCFLLLTVFQWPSVVTADDKKGPLSTICEVTGESRGNNPSYCAVFKDDIEDDGRGSKRGGKFSVFEEKNEESVGGREEAIYGDPKDLDCCIIAQRNNQIPKALQNYVRLLPDKQIEVYYQELSYEDTHQLRPLLEQVLIPLISPTKNSIHFQIRAQYKDGNDCWPGTDDDLDDWHRQRLYPNQITFSYTRYPNPDDPRAMQAEADDGCWNTLCRNFVFAYRSTFVSTLKEANVSIYNHPETPFYTLDILRNNKNDPSKPFRPVFTPINHNTMCPVDLREIPGLGYYLPFRLVYPEMVAYNREDTFKETGGLIHSYRNHSGVYLKLYCPFKITFDKNYRLLVPQKLRRH